MILTGKNKKQFVKWYEEKVWSDEFRKAGYYFDISFFTPEMQFGIYLEYYQKIASWILYVQPYSDKFAIVIDKFWDERVYYSQLINNNYGDCQRKLLAKADELMNKELNDN